MSAVTVTALQFRTRGRPPQFVALYATAEAAETAARTACASDGTKTHAVLERSSGRRSGPVREGRSRNGALLWSCSTFVVNGNLDSVPASVSVLFLPDGRRFGLRRRASFEPVEVFASLGHAEECGRRAFAAIHAEAGSTVVRKTGGIDPLSAREGRAPGGRLLWAAAEYEIVGGAR